MSGADSFPATAAYHCQQAAEKALKAVIASIGDVIPKTHDLRVLLRRCIAIDQSLDRFYEACEELTPYSTEYRYPSDSPDPSLEQVQYGLALSEDIVVAVGLRLPGPCSGKGARLD